MPSQQTPTAFVVVGPTAVGKTCVALMLARLLQTNILSADSRQCNTELNIGVAKPTMDELAQTPHYFINSHSIHNPVDAAVYENYALNVLSGIFTTHQTAVVVGGTGLYIKALCHGVDQMPAIPAQIRQAIRSGYHAEGLEFVHRHLEQYDPELLATTLERQNPHRMMRALEFAMATGASIRHFQTGIPIKRPFKLVMIGLELPKEELTQRINARVDNMMQEGLYAEVQQLLPFKHLSALQTVGYREFFEHFEGRCSPEAAVEFIKRNTRHYAKRQLTWFKKDAETTWFSPNDEADICAFVKHKLAQSD
ncbi:MAG: tRNA (adenosine(37)-N6)-dimethylallyltransferase MiaA [Bacteroidetes bacterium]|nr:MAG: tRNA (adenosine(37)-N6)-dimethylallyltransferase MiaA [Bacteroidota bacterium]